MHYTHVVTWHGNIVYHGFADDCVQEAAILNTHYQTNEYRVEPYDDHY